MDVHTLDDHPRGWHHDHDSRRGCDTWITTGSRPSWSLSLRAVFELRHVEVELSFEQRPRGCGPSSSYDTQSKPQEGAGLAHQSRRRTRHFGKSPRNLMPGSEPVWANGLGQRFGATVWGNGLGQRFGATVRHNLSARPSGVWLRAVFELRHEEGAGHNQNPMRGARQGHRQFFERTSTLHRVGYNRLTSL